jgi:ribosomal protein S7
MKKHIKKNLVNALIKKGLKLKAYNLIIKTFFFLKKKKKKPLNTVTQAILRIIPVSVTKSMKRGKHDIYVLLPLSIKAGFHIAITTLLKNTDLDKKKNYNSFWNTFSNEINETINKKSKSYQLRLKTLKDVKFVTSFSR